MTSYRMWAAALLITTCGALTSCSGKTATPPVPTAPATASNAPSASAPRTSDKPSPVETESNPPGDIPDNQVFVAYAPPGSKVSVKVPEGWARSKANGATVFTDKLNRIVIAPTTASAAPTVASVSSADVPTLQASVPRFAPGKVTAEKRAGGPVILVTYQGDSPQDPVTGKVVRDAFERYIYYHGNQRLDLTLSGPVNADNVDPWKIVSESVRWQ
jgi:hypothetical protein